MGVLTRGAILAMTAVLAVACHDAVEPLDDFLLVHSVLHAGADTARVRFERVEGGTNRWSSIRDGTVVLEGPAGSTALPFVPGAPCVDTATLPIAPMAGCYEDGLGRAVTPGDAYSFQANVDGEQVTGSTRVPLPPALRILEEPWMRFPLPHPYIPVSVAWDTEPLVGRIEARLDVVRGHQRGGVWSDAGCTLEQPTFVHDPRRGDAEIRVREIGCDFDWDSMAVEIRSTAYDTAYARYVRVAGPASKGVAVGEAAAGIDGGYGAFGAATTAVDTFFIQRESPPQ